MQLPALPVRHKQPCEFRTFEKPNTVSGRRFRKQVPGKTVACALFAVLARKVIKEARLRNNGTIMTKFHVNCGIPARPGLFRVNSQFTSSPHPITTRLTFRVPCFVDRPNAFLCPFSLNPRNELKQNEARTGQVQASKGNGNGVGNA
jgi:hypothetical protein